MEQNRAVPLTARQLMLASLIWVGTRGVSIHEVCRLHDLDFRPIEQDLRWLIDWQVIEPIGNLNHGVCYCTGNPFTYHAEWFDGGGWKALQKLIPRIAVSRCQSFHLGWVADEVYRNTVGAAIQVLFPQPQRNEHETDKDWIMRQSLYHVRIATQLDLVGRPHLLAHYQLANKYQALSVAELGPQTTARSPIEVTVHSESGKE